MNVRKRAFVNVFLLLLLVAVASTSWFLRSSVSNTNYEFLPDMAHSPRFAAYSSNPNFSDGQTLQAPPTGTIPREHQVLHYTSAQADALRAGAELSNPYGPGTNNSLQRGAKVFGNYCVVCHGSDGAGMGPVAQRGFPPPPSLLLPHAVQMRDGQMFHVLTYGQNNMPAYASQLTEEDRWNVITHVRSMQNASLKMSAAQTPPAVPKGEAQ
ncbi:MAG TPA: cytochrome c [Terriglobales bacterium]|nr:cytochrome c [Terriglobales bacterium]